MNAWIVNVTSRTPDGIYAFEREVDADVFCEALGHDDYELVEVPLLDAEGADHLIRAEVASSE